VSSSAEIKFNEEVTDIKINSQGTEVITHKSSFSSKFFINCSGLYSDEIAVKTGAKLDVRIIPFRGEYYRIRDDRKYLIRNLIYPVPDPEFPFLGVHFTRKINGDIEAGPNAVLAFSKEGYSKSSFRVRDFLSIMKWQGFYKVSGRYFKTGMGEFYRSLVKDAFVKSLRKLVPDISPQDLVTGGSGVRAQAVDRNGKLVDDFIIHQGNGVINVLNAPSPAATASLAIGSKIADLYLEKSDF
ncbi:MAG: L-2-hydroxyglutarate oxidase, partial [Ignavibacteria bacterium]|nr:L-2-hydroxyglutarate oxidase [Ignavibacteria bacterium]